MHRKPAWLGLRSHKIQKTQGLGPLKDQVWASRWGPVFLSYLLYQPWKSADLLGILYWQTTLHHIPPNLSGSRLTGLRQHQSGFQGRAVNCCNQELLPKWAVCWAPTLGTRPPSCRRLKRSWASSHSGILSIPSSSHVQHQSLLFAQPSGVQA